MKKGESSLVGLLLGRLWLIALFTAIGVTASVLLHMYVIQPTYKSSATLYVQEIRSDNTTANGYNELLAAELIVTDAKVLLASESMLSAAAKKVDISVAEFSELLVIGSGDSPRTIKITIEASDPTFAVESVKALVETFVQNSKRYFPNYDFAVVDSPLLPKSPENGDFIKVTAASAGSGMVLGALLVVLFGKRKNKKTEENYDLDMPIL